MPYYSRIRQACDLDFEEILAISSASLPVEESLTVDDLLHASHLSDVRIIVAESGGLVIGFAVYSRAKGKIVINQICVSRELRDFGVGAGMMTYIVNRLSKKRTHVSANVPESNLCAQKFLGAIGFKAIRILHGYKEGEDAYLMVCNAQDFFAVGDKDDEPISQPGRKSLPVVRRKNVARDQ